MLKHDVRHEDELPYMVGHLFEPLVKLLHMRVYKLGGEADVIAHHRVQRSLISLEVALGTEHHLEAGLCEKRVPEWEILIHVENSGDGNYGLLGI